MHYMYVLIAGAAIVMLGLTGIASSYARMLLKVSALRMSCAPRRMSSRIATRVWKRCQERDIQVASLALWQAKVSSLYG